MPYSCIHRAPLRLIVGLVGTLCLAWADSGIRVEVRHATATLEPTADHDVYMLKLNSSLRVTNRSVKVLDFPTLGVDENDAISVSLIGMQSKEPDGKWISLGQASLYDAGTTKYAQCTSLLPRRLAEIKSVSLRWAILRQQIASVRGQPTFRLNLYLSCRKADGTVRGLHVTTDDVQIGLIVPGPDD